MGEISALPFVVAVPAYVVVGFTVVDAARRSDLATSRKAVWIVVAIVLPVLGTLLYLLSRPFHDPGLRPARVNASTEELIALLQQHATGAIDDNEFAAAKARIFSS